MRSGGLFAGYGGLDMAVAEVFGAEPAWFSEIDEAPSKILAHHWPDVPNLGDITQIDWDAVEPVDIQTGGFPCQDVSAAGKRAGLKPGTRSGLWNHMAYAISKLRPRFVVAENVRGLLSADAHSDLEPCPWCLGDGHSEPALRALGAVLADLAELGYDAQWCGLRAADVGAPHGRFRVFVLAEDANLAAGGQRRVAAPGQAEGRRPWADAGGRGGAPAADTGRSGWWQDNPGGRGVVGKGGLQAGWDQGAGTPGPDSATAADADSYPVREQPVSESGCRGKALAGITGSDAARSGASPSTWGQYAGAIRRWELTLDRFAPAPTETSEKGSQRLSPRFVEWMMGLPAGHVTDVPGVNRNAQLKALGNGVVPQQAVAALRHMLSVREVAA